MAVSAFVNGNKLMTNYITSLYTVLQRLTVVSILVAIFTDEQYTTRNVAVAVDKEPRLETSCTHWIGSCSIAHQFHVVSTNAAMSLYGINTQLLL